MRGLDIRFSIQGEDASQLEQITGQPVPVEGVYELSGRLTDPSVKTHRFGDLNIVIGENDLRGGADLDLTESSPMIALALESTKTTLAPVTIKSVEPLRGIPDLGPLKLAVRVVGQGDRYIFKDLDLNFGKDELVSVIVKGTVKDPSIPKGMDLDFAVRSTDLTNFETLGGKSVPLQGALTLSGHFADIAPNVYRTSSLTAIWGESEHNGWVELDLSGERPTVRADLSSSEWDLRQVLTRETPADGAGQITPTSDKVDSRVFSIDPINFKGLSRIDTDLKLRNQQTLLPRMVINDVEMHLRLENGHLQITPFTFRIGEGSADILFDLESNVSPPRWVTEIHLAQLGLGAELDQLEKRALVEGKLDVEVRLDGSGDSMAALMSGLKGDIRILIKDGRIVSRYLELFQRYMGDVRQIFNPFQVRREYTPINCWVTNTNIKDGLADIRVLLDTDQTTLISAGNINLKTERVNLGIRPNPKRSYGVSISLRRLSQPFRLRGPLASPSLAISAGGTFATIGRAFGFGLFGPVGWAAFFTDISVGRRDACEVAAELYAYRGELAEAPEVDEVPGAAGDDSESPGHRGPDR